VNTGRRGAEIFIAFRVFRDNKKNFELMSEIVAQGPAALI
jgi:hypothetical protein